jgi:hypothetical protein
MFSGETNVVRNVSGQTFDLERFVLLIQQVSRPNGIGTTPTEFREENFVGAEDCGIQPSRLLRRSTRRQPIVLKTSA